MPDAAPGGTLYPEKDHETPRHHASPGRAQKGPRWRGPAGPKVVLGWAFAYQRPLRERITRLGLLRTAPVSVSFLAICLLISLLWATPGWGHWLVMACCAYRGWRPELGAIARLVPSAFLLRHLYEAMWTVAATVLVTAPFEASVGSVRMLATVTLGHLLPTIGVAVAGLDHAQRLGGGGLDVGASAVVVAAAGGLAVRSRSPTVIGCLVVAQLVAVSVESPLANAEHIAALVIGGLVTAALAGGPSASSPRQSRGLLHVGGAGNSARPELTGRYADDCMSSTGVVRVPRAPGILTHAAGRPAVRPGDVRD